MEEEAAGTQGDRTLRHIWPQGRTPADDATLPGFQQNARNLFGEIKDKVGSTYDSLTTTASGSYSALSSTASEVWTDTAMGVQGRFAALRDKIRQAFPPGEGEEEGAVARSEEHTSELQSQ